MGLMLLAGNNPALVLGFISVQNVVNVDGAELQLRFFRQV
jgi:hypothetical protein